MKKLSLVFFLLSIMQFQIGCFSSSDEASNDTTPPVTDPGTNPPSTPGGPTSSYSLSDDVFFIGHSLVGPTLPEMMGHVLDSQGSSALSSYQVINGSPLGFNWNNSSTAQGMNSRAVIPNGAYEILVITEAVPLANHTEWSDSNGNALRFYNLAMSANASARVYLYETWHCLNSGTPTGCDYDDNDSTSWRSRLDSELWRWEGIADYVNAQKGSNQRPMYLVPVGQAFALLFDEIQAGRVPGITNINQLFSDDIHVTNAGFYFVTMVQYATLYGRSPVGLTRQLGAYSAPSQALATKMQEVAWTAVCNYDRSGVTCQ